MKNTQDITLYNSFTPEKCRNIPYPAPPIMSIIHMLPKNDGNRRLYFFSYIISAQNRVVIIENREVTTSDARSVCVSIVTRSSRLCLEAPAKSAINIEASNSKNPRIIGPAQTTAAYEYARIVAIIPLREKSFLSSNPMPANCEAPPHNFYYNYQPCPDADSTSELSFSRIPPSPAAYRYVPPEAPSRRRAPENASAAR